MPGERVATDVVGDDLVAIYRAGVRSLEATIQTGLRRGLDPSRIGTDSQQVGDATAAYRERQLAVARAQLEALRLRGRGAAAELVGAAYRSSLVAVDRVTLGEVAGIEGRFGGLHERVISTLAANLEQSLERAAARTRQNLDTVFARAGALQGALQPGGDLARLQFVGRRVNDPWRRLALEEIGRGQVALETRVQTSRALAERLVREGAVDATSGLVDLGGRRWSLDDYVEMAVRTTTREATSRATMNRLADHSLELVAVSSHPHAADECTPYDGNTFARPGTDAAQQSRYPTLQRIPPFHPRCRHVLCPAGASFEDFERELGIAAREQLDPAAPKTPAPAPAPRPEVGDRVTVTQALDPYTGKRLKGSSYTGSVARTSPDGGLIINAGSSNKPRWVQAHTDHLQLPDGASPPELTRLPPKPAAQLRPVSDVLGPRASAEHLRALQADVDLSPRAREALKAYVNGAKDGTAKGGWAANTISRKLRQSKPLTGPQRDYVDAMDEAFDTVEPTREAITLFRGIDTNLNGRSRLADVDVGSVVDDAGYVSTSASKAVAQRFARADGDVLEVVLPAGAKVLDVNALRSGSGFGEREVVLPRGSRFIVESIKTRRSTRTGPLGRDVVEGRTIRVRLVA